MNENCDVDQLTMYLTRYIDNIETESIVDNNVIYRIKTEFDYKFRRIIHDLEMHQADLQLAGFAVFAPTMTETVIKLGRSVWKRDSADGM